MSLTPREIAAAVARSQAGGRDKPLRATTGAALTGGYLRQLKARRAEVGVWEIRGRVFARVMLAARDAKLSGAESGLLTTIALHLQHLGRSKGMMTVASLADDCDVTERTIRNALRVLAREKFISITVRHSGQMTVMLDRRFGPKAQVPGNKSADNSPRRSVPRKKISTIKPSLQSGFITNECTDSAPSTARRESPASVLQARTATACGADPRLLPALAAMVALASAPMLNAVACHDPPRKRAAPVASG